MCRHWQDSFDAQHTGNCRRGDRYVHNNQPQFLHRCSITSAHSGEFTREEIRCISCSIDLHKNFWENRWTNALQLYVRINLHFWILPPFELKLSSWEVALTWKCLVVNLCFETIKNCPLTANCSILQITKDSSRVVHYRWTNQGIDAEPVLARRWLLLFICWLFITRKLIFFICKEVHIYFWLYRNWTPCFWSVCSRSWAWGFDWREIAFVGVRYGPPGSKRLVYFIDDANMPLVDKYDTQSAIELIRQAVDYKGWYDKVYFTLVTLIITISQNFFINHDSADGQMFALLSCSAVCEKSESAGIDAYIKLPNLVTKTPCQKGLCTLKQSSRVRPEKLKQTPSRLLMNIMCNLMMI